MRDQINRWSEFFDHQVTRRFIHPKPVQAHEGEVIAFLFHRLFTPDELQQPIYLHERVTVDLFEQFLSYFHAREYAFVTPTDLLENRHLGKRCVMVTFDDGYADNLRALPLLERYNAKATFFISPAHIVENRRFWWDALHAQGERSFGEFQNIPIAAAHARILQQWPDALTPQDDSDRALTLQEFQTLAQSERVEIGHHSYNHTVLAERDTAYVVAEIEQSADFFRQHLGYNPVSIAYPNGVYSDALIDQCYEQGLRIGLTCDFRSERLSQQSDPQQLNPHQQSGPQQLMRLGRCMISGSRPLMPQIHSAILRPSLKQQVYHFKRSIS